MPRPKVTFKNTMLDLEIRDLEITVGTETIKAGHLKASLDVADLLRTPLKTETTGLRLLDHGERKIQVIKTIRQFTGLPLKEAKEASENTPWQYDSGRVKEFARELEAAGAVVECDEGRPKVTVLDKLRELLTEAVDAS